MRITGLSPSRLPMIRQTTLSECGLASLAMIAGYHGKSIDLYTIRSRYATSLRGMNFVDVQSVAEQLGFAGRGVRAPVEHLNRLQLPAILHWDKKHFVVLAAVNRRNVVIHDPAVGITKIPLSELPEHYEGYAMEFTPTLNFSKEKASDTPSFLLLFHGLHEVKRGLLFIFFISLGLELFVNLIPLYTQWVIDDVVTTADFDLLTLLFTGYVFAVSFQTLISWVRSWVMLRFGILINAAIQVRVFSHMLKLPCSFFEQRYVGDVVSRFHSLHAVQSALTTTFVTSVIDGLMCLFVGVIIFTYSAQLSLLALGFVAVYAVLRWLRYLPLKTAARDQLIVDAALSSHFLETIRGVRGIKLFNKQTTRRDQWFRHLHDSYNKNITVSKINMNYGHIGSLLFSIERGLVIYIGAQQVIAGSMTVGFLLAFLAYKDQFVGRLNSLIERAIEFGMVRLEVERLWDIIGTDPEEETDLPYLSGSAHGASIEFKDVSFRYSRYEPYILEKLNISVAEGEHVVIVGRSGSGKSTIAKLILGVQRPDEGEILLGGISLAAIGSQARAMISAVMQDDELYSGTLLENISFFDNEPDLAWVEECAKMAEIHTEIASMKMGYNSIVGDMGSALSGGQKQRVLLARALYSKPRVIVLDEFTSDLDIELERRIGDNIKTLNITRISIAHRPQTIASADRIIDLSALKQGGLS